MANTNVLKNVEQYVRRWCLNKYGIEFENQEKRLCLITGGFISLILCQKTAL